MDAPWFAGFERLLIMNFLDRDERTMLAGEYVLGTMPPEDVVIFEQEMLRNREVASEVAFWRDRMLDVMPAPIAVEPTANLWARIENSVKKKTGRPKPASFWNSLSVWRATSLAGLAASILLAVRLFIVAPAGDAVQYIALLQAPNQGATWIVKVDGDAVHLRPLAPVSVAAGKSLQFWTKPEGAAGPTSLGLVPPDQPVSIPLNKLPGVSANQLFEVTLEPKTGSPIGKPTGPILAVGKAVQI